MVGSAVGSHVGTVVGSVVGTVDTPHSRRYIVGNTYIQVPLLDAS